MISVFCVIVLVFIVFIVFGFVVNLINRSEFFRNFEMFNVDGKFVIGKI